MNYCFTKFLLVVTASSLIRISISQSAEQGITKSEICPCNRAASKILEDQKSLRLLREYLSPIQEDTLNFDELKEPQNPGYERRQLTQDSTKWFQRSDFNNSNVCVSNAIYTMSYALDTCLLYSSKNGKYAKN